MPKRPADCTQDANPKRRRVPVDEVLVEAARNGDTTALRAGLEKLSPNAAGKTATLDAVHEACKENQDKCLALLLPYVDTTQIRFGMLLSRCIQANHFACTEALLQHGVDPLKEHPPGTCPFKVCIEVDADAHLALMLARGLPANTQYREGESIIFSCVRMRRVQVLALLLDANVSPNEGKGNPLCGAAYDGHLESAELLVAAGAGLEVHSATDASCARPLYIAASRGHADVVQFLLAKGADREHRSDGLSALDAAIVGNNLACVKVLVYAGAVVDNPAGEGGVPLAVRADAEDVLHFLLGRGTTLNPRASEHPDAVPVLELSNIKGRPAVVAALLEAGALGDGVGVVSHNYNAAHLACHSGNVECLRLLLRAGISPVFVAEDHDTLLHVAVGSGHTECTRELLAQGAPVDALGEDQMTPLMLAARNDRPSCVVLLLEAGANMEIKTPENVTALLWAAAQSPSSLRELILQGANVIPQEGEASELNPFHAVAQCRASEADEAVALLLKSGMDVDNTVNMEKTALLEALMHENITMSASLLKNGASVSKADSDGNTALHHAASAENDPKADLVHMVLKHGAVIDAVNNAQETPLHVAVHYNNTPGVVALLAAGARTDLRDHSDVVPFHEALRRGLTCATAFLDKGASATAVCADGRYPMVYAAAGGNVELGEMLLQKGACVNKADKDGQTPLISAAGNKLPTNTFVNFLLDNGAKVGCCDNNGNTALHFAVECGDEALCRLLAERGVPLEAKDDEGDTALSCAVVGVKPAVCQALLDAGADVNATTELGRTPLLVASHVGELEVVKLLEKSRADVRATDHDGDTCLILAADAGHTETVRYLVGLKDVDVNYAGNNGCTALHCAAQEKHADVVQALLEHGADRALCDRDGDTALDCATQGGCSECCRLLS